jgi:hypothetical protein
MQGRRAGEVLAALFGFFSAIFFAGPASAQSTTHTTISSSLNPSQVGDLVDFTIDVVGTGGCTPQLLAQGGVIITVNGSQVGSVPATSNSQFTTVTLPGGADAVVAKYSGTPSCATSSGSVAQTVNPINSTTVVTSSPNRSRVGQAVTFTVTVGPLSPFSPTGTVTFLLDGSPLSTVPVENAQAIFTDSALTAGPHSVTANYSGDGNYNSSSGSLASPQVVIGVAHDYNGDGKADLLWRDTSGDLVWWLMNGATVTSSGGTSGVPADQSIVGQRDFNGDGMVDLLWRDSSGDASIWFMNGTSVSSASGLGTVSPDWTIVGTGDFNGDRHGDILWRDNSPFGNLAMWLMNGAQVSQIGGIGSVAPTWTVVGTGDFNGDTKSDILWRNTDSSYWIWFMNGTAVTSTALVGYIPANWSIVGTGDFNGDGMADIVWRDTAGDTAIWLMNGASVLSSGGLGNVPTTYSIALVGDYNNDGMSDLLWQDNLGNTSMWFMNGTTVAAAAVVGNVSTNWTVQSLNAE